MSNRTSAKPRKKMSARNGVVAREVKDLVEVDAEANVRDSYNSLNHYLKMHRSCRDEGLEPNEGSILNTLWRKGQLSRQQAMAWQWWYQDMRRAIGNTNALHVGYSGASEGNFVSREAERAYPGHSTYWTAEAAKIEEVWERLRDHERGLIEQLFRDTLRTEGLKEVHAHDLKYIGNFLSGYNDDRQKIAAGVSAIQRLLTSLAEIYRIPHFFD